MKEKIRDYLKKTSSLDVEEKLSRVSWHEAEESNLDIESKATCRECETRFCEIICPAEVWVFEEGDNLPNIQWENCLECGACRIVCPENNIVWEHQEGGEGFAFKFG